MERSTLGARVAHYRKRKGWSQRLLAHKADVSNVTISDIESGARERPRIDILQRIAAALTVSLDDLLGGHSSEDAGEGGTGIFGQDEPEPQSVEALIHDISIESRDVGMDPRETEEFLLMWWRLPDEVRRLMRLQAETYTRLQGEHDSGKRGREPSRADEEGGQAEGGAAKEAGG